MNRAKETKPRNRYIPQPVEEIPEYPDQFAALPGEKIAIAIENKLTGAEWALWAYLVWIDPRASRNKGGDEVWHPLPPPPQVAIRLGLDRKTVERAAKRLDELDLYKIRPTAWEGFNSTAECRQKHSEERASRDSSKTESKSSKKANNATRTKQSQSGLNSPKKTKQSQSGQDSSNQGLEGLQEAGFESPLDLLDLDHDLIDQKERKANPKKQTKNRRQKGNSTSTVTTQASVTIPDENLDTDDDQSSAAGTNVQKNVDWWVTFDWTEFVAPGTQQGFERGFFDSVVRRAEKFTNPVPAHPPSAAESWIRKQGHLLYPEYLQWKVAIDQRKQQLEARFDPPPPPANYQPPSAEEIFERRKSFILALAQGEKFQQLKHYFDQLLASGERSQVEQLMKLHPEHHWKIRANKAWRDV